MITYNIGLYEEISKIISELSSKYQICTLSVLLLCLGLATRSATRGSA